MGQPLVPCPNKKPLTYVLIYFVHHSLLGRQVMCGVKGTRDPIIGITFVFLRGGGGSTAKIRALENLESNGFYKTRCF